MLEFLKTVWPTDGYYCIAYKSKNLSGFVQRAFATVEEATTYASKIKNADVYFAVGSLVELDESSKASRKSDNIKSFHTFIVDIDVGDSKDYKTRQQAISELIRFSKALTLPKPTIVDSGYGFHVYWTLDRDISADEWSEVASNFKLVVKHLDFKADETRTADRASVLRVPNTINLKNDTVKEVKVVNIGEPMSYDWFKNTIEDYCELHGLAAVVRSSTMRKDLALLAEHGVERMDNNFEDSWFKNIVPLCQTMKFAQDNRATLSEPQWWAALSIAKFCQDYEQAMLSVSEDHPEFKLQAMLSKAERFTAPISCEKLRSTFGNTCDGCQQSCKTPLTLGYKINITPNVIYLGGKSDDAESEIVLPNITLEDYPPRYALSGGKIVYDRSDEDAGGYQTIYEHPIRFICRVRDFIVQTDAALFKVELPHDGNREFQIPLASAYDTKTVLSILGGAGIIVTGASETKGLLNFMSSYMASIIKRCAAEKNYSQLGWQEDGKVFVMADKTIRDTGEITNSGASKSIQNIAKQMHTKGTLEEWVSVINTYGRAGYEAYAFGHCVGYGSLLFYFTQQEGAIVNMVGDSGSGKSTVLRTINTMFGHPTKQMMTQVDTNNSRMHRIAVMNSICPTYDELTNIAPDELSQLCYSISQGRERGRLKADGTAKDNEGTWKSIVAATSNSSIYEKLSMLKTDASAESLRVFEYHVRTDIHSMSLKEAEEHFGKLSENYGHAGQVFINWVVQHQSEVREIIKKWSVRFDTLANVPIKERYWSSIVSVVLAGAEISNKLALNNFDAEVLLNFAVEQVSGMRQSVNDNKQDAKGLLVEYLNQSIRNSFVLSGGIPDDNGKDMPYTWAQEPNNRLDVRIEIDRGIAYISRTAIRKWLVEGGSEYTHIKNELMTRRILLNDKVDKVISSGSKVIKSGQVKCWLVDLNHKELAGGASLTVVNNTRKSKEVVAQTVNS